MFIRRLPRFDFHAPASLPEALDLMAQHGSGARFMAGGTDLLLAMKKREIAPGHVVSLANIPSLKGIGQEGGMLRIGALTTLGEIERSPLVKERLLPLRDAVEKMASAQIRNLATIGGNLCSAVPSADTAPPLIALSGSLFLLGPSGERTVSVEDFFTGPKATLARPDEILTSIMIPKPGPLSSGCYLKLMRRHAMDLALVGVAVCLKLDGDKVCREVRIALGAVAPTPVRVPEIEALLIGKRPDEAVVAEAARIAGMQCRPITDIRASLEYRCSMVEVLTRRAVMEAFRRAAG
jgi:carbon-monoxide dehydrogenase medium subunit